MDLSWIAKPESWVAFASLAALEIVLGIDNIVFISILSGKLPVEQQQKARNLGLGLAMITRILLLLSLSWVMSLTTDLFHIPILDSMIPAGESHGGGHGSTSVANVSTPGGISGRDLILLFGGLFLMGKSVHEIHHKLEGAEGDHGATAKTAAFGAILIQILLLDIVFSLDSVITAVGMAQEVAIMIAAVIAAVAVMLFAAGPISAFVEKHPTVKMLALSFLLLIGVSLLAEGLQIHIPKGFIYFAMGFSIFVEMLNLKLRKHHDAPLKLREPH